MIENIRIRFYERGYLLFSTNYVNAHQKLSYVCFKHPTVLQQIQYHSFVRGCGCFYCGIESRSLKRKLTIEKVMRECSLHDCTFVSCELSDSKSYVQFICNKHKDKGVLFARYNNIQQDQYCKYCREDSRKRGTSNILYKGQSMYLSQYVRSYLDSWKKQVVNKDKYVCDITYSKPANQKFVIHHLQSSHALLEAILTSLGITKIKPGEVYSYEQLQKIGEVYCEAHKELLGVFISTELHKLFHKTYGNRNNTPEQYYEFKSDFQKDGSYFNLEGK